MKKFIILLAVSIAAVSCSSLMKTASEQNVNGNIAAAVIADLDISNQKITYTYVPTLNVRKLGAKNCINAAISEALLANGNGDILIETQAAVIQTQGLFGRKIKSVTVSGYPAKYKNFKSADEETIKAGIVSGSLTVKGATVTIKRK